MNIRPACVVCNTLFYTAGNGNGHWRLLPIQHLKGKLVSPDYPYQKGIVCPACIKKIELTESLS
jgi:hypothetical protein